MNRYQSLCILTGLATSVLVVQQVSAQPSNLYQQARPSVVLIQNTAGIRQGTGFIVNGNNGTYYVLTAGHVVRNGQFQVVTSSEVKPVETVIPLPGVDLALIQFSSSNSYPIAKLANDTRSFQALTRISILGYPINESGEPAFPTGTITSRQNSPFLGVASAIFHSVETKPGMSGSPVLNDSGEVIGVHIGEPDQRSFREAIPIENYRNAAPLVFTQASRDNLRAGSFDQAIASLDQVRNIIGQDSPEAIVIRAYAYFGKGELPRARDEVRQISSSNAEAALLVGAIDYLQGNTASAINNLNIAVNLDRRNLGGYALAILGLSYADNSSTSQANISVSSAVGLMPNDSFVSLASSCVKIKVSGDITGATADLNNANRLREEKPTNSFLAVISPRLQENVRRCIPPELSTQQISPVLSGRYKSSNPVQLGEESTALAVSRDSRLVATGLRDGTVSVYDIQTKNRVASFRYGQERDDTSSIAFSPDGKNIAIAATNGMVKVFNIQSQQERYSLADAGRRPLVVFNNNNNLLFIGSGSGTLRMVDNRNGRVILAEANTHTGGMTALTLSPDGRLLASSGVDGTIKLWNTSDITPIDSYQAHQGSIPSLAFSPDGSQIISIGDRVVKSCNWQNKSCNSIANARDDLNSLAVASNGHIAFSEVSFLIKPENPILLRDLRSGQSLGNLLGHRDRIVALAYTPDSRYLISGSSDGTIIIWEVQ